MLMLLMALAQVSPAAPVAEEKPIVVTGKRLSDTKRALDACLARHCPPTEDIDASLAHAENQFLGGDYEAARSTLLAARHRNARYAKTLPVQVADLTRANARMAALVGLPDVARINTIDTIDALKAGLPDTDPRILSQRLEIGDIFAHQGRLRAATDIYDIVAKQARAAGLSSIQGFAMLRKAVLYGAIAGVDSRYKSSSRAAIRAIEEGEAPGLAPFRDAANLLKAQIAAYDGDKTALDAAIASMQKAKVARPILLFAPVIKSSEIGRDVMSSTGATFHGSDKAQWADVSFWVAPDGTVRDVDVLRHSDVFDNSWLKGALQSLAGRRYQPLAMDAGLPGLLRVERFSFVYDRKSDTSSRIVVRSGIGHIETLDLTVDPPLATGAAPG